MKALLRSALAWPADLLAAYDAALSRIRPSLDGYVRGRAIARAFAAERSTTYNGIELSFCCPSWIAAWRALTFATKEPETLEWLDGLSGVFWDIGANVGLYSIYFARRHRARAFAFEPSVFNLELLARNIYRNGADVAVLPFALSSRTKLDKLRLTSTEHAGALSAFGVEHGSAEFEYATLGISIDDALNLGIPAPDHLKIDVDGIEHEILAGALHTLRTVRSVLVELDDRFAAQAQSARELLSQAGLALERSAPGEGGQHNEIWLRS